MLAPATYLSGAPARWCVWTTVWTILLIIYKVLGHWKWTCFPLIVFHDRMILAPHDFLMGVITLVGNYFGYFCQQLLILSWHAQSPLCLSNKIHWRVTSRSTWYKVCLTRECHCIITNPPPNQFISSSHCSHCLQLLQDAAIRAWHLREGATIDGTKAWTMCFFIIVFSYKSHSVFTFLSLIRENDASTAWPE